MKVKKIINRTETEKYNLRVTKIPRLESIKGKPEIVLYYDYSFSFNFLKHIRSPNRPIPRTGSHKNCSWSYQFVHILD